MALRTSILEDVYVILAGWEPSRIATFKVFVNPLIAWVWLGGLVMVLGTLVAIWPERRAPVVERRQDTAVTVGAAERGGSL